MIAGGYWRKKGKQGWVSLLGGLSEPYLFFPCRCPENSGIKDIQINRIAECRGQVAEREVK